ncbi:MAG: hypothetical protein QM703_26930 [Gemmatales bacterium]
MGENIQEIVAAIDQLASVDAVDDLNRLHELAVQYFACAGASEYLDVWFRLYERFPEDDAFGVFWTILHSVEAQPNHGPLVVVSVRRSPSRFPVRMVNRLLNSGIQQVDGVDLLELLRAVAANDHCPPEVREEAAGFLEYQQSSAGRVERKRALVIRFQAKPSSPHRR